ncbi:hypothetical protein VN97_g5512 [Penicillium thymicola]|uniref:Uncharacterized protein n=1 Tax=Penicillium thymicola TaxID=293382 RepID=A0AAI9TIJ4_PENTH|nr:hypothetical protein VN97_g5512 [Penicillium thymicola]
MEQDEKVKIDIVHIRNIINATVSSANRIKSAFNALTRTFNNAKEELEPSDTDAPGATIKSIILRKMRRFERIHDVVETVERYRAGGYHPVHLEDIFHHRDRIVGKWAFVPRLIVARVQTPLYI